MSDNNTVTIAIAANVRKRMAEKGLPTYRLHHEMQKVGGPATKAPMFKILAGEGAVCSNTRAALCTVLKAENEQSISDTWAALKRMPECLKTATEPKPVPPPRLYQTVLDFSPDAEAEQVALEHRIGLNAAPYRPEKRTGIWTRIKQIFKGQ